MNKSESRYFATAARMDEAFLTLLAKKDFEYITVKEICEVAGVNRSTFYLHYETMSDLLSKVENLVGNLIVCFFVVSLFEKLFFEAPSAARQCHQQWLFQHTVFFHVRSDGHSIDCFENGFQSSGVHQVLF